MTVPRRPRAVLFDLDGTLADSTPLIAEAIASLLHDRGYAHTAAEIEPRIGPPLDDMLRDLLGVSQDEADALFSEYLERYTRDYAQRTPAMPGAEALLDALGAANVALAIVSNKVERAAVALLDALGWTGRFAAIMAADTTSRPKPAPDAPLEALRRLDVPPTEAAFVGDNEIDMECAHDAGIPTVIGLATQRRPESLRAAGATHTCPSLDAVQALLLGDGTGNER